MKPTEGRYLATVDHLRALAAFEILVYHGSQLFGFFLATGKEGFSWTPWPHAGGPVAAVVTEGHSAVSLFMVLSGFIFSNGSWDREVDYKTFLANRLWRIYPMFVAVSLYGWMAIPAGFTLLGGLQSLLPLAGMPGGFSNDVVAVSWAIGVEFQFYLVFPFLHRFTRRVGLRYLVGVLALMLLLRAWAFVYTGHVHDLAYWTIIGHMDQFVLGILVAHAHRRFVARGAARRWAFVPALALLSGWLWWFNATGGWLVDSPSRILWPLLDGAAYALVIFTYLAFEDLPRYRASWPSRALARVGEISFSMYLLHYFIVKTLVHANVVVRWAGDPHANALLTTVLVAAPCTLLASFLTFNVIERPFFQFRKSYLRG
jgi:peptidoglycan/LPS O-acetylase OafA/YrhL